MMSACPKMASSVLAAGAGLEWSGPMLDVPSNPAADTRGSGADAASLAAGSCMPVVLIRLAVRGGGAGLGIEDPEGSDGVC